MGRLVAKDIRIIVDADTISLIGTVNGIELYKTDGTTGGDLFIGLLSVQGGSITLRSQQSGTPTLDASLLVERGASTDSEIRWDEVNDEWRAGLVGASRRITLRRAVDITNANLVSGNYTFNHALGVYPQVQVIDNSGNLIGMTVNHTDVNNVVINFSNVLVSGSLVGTWRIIVEG